MDRKDERPLARRGRAQELNAGDVGYVPQGYNGAYQSISLSARVAANPNLLLATNFECRRTRSRIFQRASGVHAGVTLVAGHDNSDCSDRPTLLAETACVGACSGKQVDDSCPGI
jgi:hypothetical protein